MALFEELHPAKYKEVNFLVNSSSMSGGRKDILHEFPNSNKQIVEDLGPLPRNYSLIAVITGDNYLQRRDQLLAKLEEGGPGTLVHPFYGIVENVVARSYSIVERFDNLGAANIEIVFDQTGLIDNPTRAQISLSQLSRQNDIVDAVLRANISDNFNVSDFAIGSLENSVGKLNSFINQFFDSTKYLDNGTDFVNSLSSQINEFSNNIGSLVQRPQALADSIGNLFQTANGASQSSDAILEAFTNLTQFGVDDLIIDVPVTFSSNERDNNNDIINSTVRAYSVSFNYLNLPEKDFLTKAQIDSELNTLNSEFTEVMALEGIDNDSKNALSDMVALSSEMIDDVRISTRRVINVETPTLPMRVIAYQYYGDSSEAENLNQINSDPNNSFISGTIGVLAE